MSEGVQGKRVAGAGMAGGARSPWKALRNRSLGMNHKVARMMTISTHMAAMRCCSLPHGPAHASAGI